MNRPRQLLVIVALLAVIPPGPSAAQNAPRRPRLPSNADTNDARAYFQLGLDRIESNASQAAQAFYWAARLDPLSPQTLYAQATALLLKDPDLLVKVIQRDQRILTNAEALAIDSLRFRAEMQDPFFHRGLEGVLLRAYARHTSRGDPWLLNPEQGNTAATERARASEQVGEERDPFLRGLLHYSDGRLQEAMRYYNAVLSNREIDFVLAERARTLAELRQLDSARSALLLAIDRWRPSTPESPRYLHESRAAWEYALGRLNEDRRDDNGASEMYRNALVHDPGYYPAHLRLAVAALRTRDSTAALARLSQATADSRVQFFAYAMAATLYVRLARPDSAIAVLRRATAAEPLASAGWLMLARTQESARDTAAAVSAYERYLALAPRDDGQRPVATRALAGLRPSP